MIKDYSKVPCTINIVNNREDNVDIDLRFVELELKAGQTLSLTVETSEQLALFINKAEELGLDVEVGEATEPETPVTPVEPETNKIVDEASLQEALADETVSEIKIEADMSLTQTLEVTRDLTIDGNGNKLTVPKEGIVAKGVKVSLKNVNIESAADVPVRASAGGKVEIAEDVTITTPLCCVAVVDEGSAVDVRGTLNAGKDACIGGNGTKNGTTINIYESAKLTSEDITLFVPQDGVVNIYGGELVGKSVVGIKGGTLNIEGGTLTATGDKVETLKANNSGMQPWGDVIAVEVNKNYVGGKTDKNIKVNISESATLTSANADIIREYNPLEGKIAIEVTGAYTTRAEAGKNTFVYTK